MLRSIVSLVLIVVFFNARAQDGCPPPYGVQNEVKRYHIAAGVGLTSLYGDVDKPGALGKTFFLKGDYQVKRGVYVGVEGQVGALEAMSSLLDPREVKNNYIAGGLMLTFHPFEFFSSGTGFQQSALDVLKNSFYVGVGILGIMNNYTDVYRDIDYGTPGYLGPVPPGNYGPIESDTGVGNPIFKKKTKSYTKPTVNMGLAIPVNRRYSKSGNYWSALVNAQLNFANNDLLDGYSPNNTIATKNDMYTMYSLGARYSF